MKTICIYSHDVRATGIKVIIKNIQKKLTGVDIHVESNINKALEYDVILPYGVLASYDVYSKDKSKCTLSLMVDAESLTNISKFHYLVNKRRVVPFKERYKELLRYFYHLYMERKIFRTYKKILLVSYYDKSYFEKSLLTSKYADKIVVVPNGVNIPNEKKSKRKQDESIVLGFLSEWWNASGDLTYERKCFLEYVWKDAVRVNPNLKLVMCGRGMSEKQKDLFKKYPNVVGIGEVEDLIDFYNQIDASIIVNVKHAGILNKALDSFAYKCPLIGEDHNFWAFKNIPNCYYTYTDGKSLAESAERIVEDEKETENKVDKAYKYVVENHNWDNNYKPLISIIERILTD